MSTSTLALITVPFVTGAIGYLTNWTGVLMLFYPVHFRGVRAEWLASFARMLPYKLRQIPGIMVGGIGWQGIIPSRAAKMGSLAVDSGIAKLGTPSEFFQQLDPEKIAEQIIDGMRGEMHDTVDAIMEREHPRLWTSCPRRSAARSSTRPAAATGGRPPADRRDRGEHRSARRREADGDQAVRPRAREPRVPRHGKARAEVHPELRLLLRLRAQNSVAALTHFVTYWWLLPVLGVVVGYVTNWVALWMIYEPAEPLRIGPFRIQGLFVKRQPEVADVYARIVADEIVTVANFGVSS